jgi:hypothetical protein
MSDAEKAAALAQAIGRLQAWREEGIATAAMYQSALEAGVVTAAEAEEVHAAAEWLMGRINTLIDRAKLEMPPAEPGHYAD